MDKGYARIASTGPGLFGAFAIVTGAGSGIGRAIVLELARYGVSCCLVGRTLSKLQEVARLTDELGVESIPIAAERARVILLAASGLNGKEIALKMKTRPARVSKWLRRFAKDRMGTLNDSPRPGEKRRKYTSATEERILEALDEAPPADYSRWNGRLLAQCLGDVCQHQVWRVMRKHNLHLERRQSWCVSTDPEFSRKAAYCGSHRDHDPAGRKVVIFDERFSFATRHNSFQDEQSSETRRACKNLTT